MNAYGFFAAAGAVTATVWLLRHHRAMGLTENEFWAAIWLIVAGAVVGAKGFFVALGWHHYASGELRLWADFGTGFVFFGGLLGAVLTGGFFAWYRRLNFWRGADFFAVALPLGHAVGRVGCFCQGCCSGRPPHPVQLYESAGLLLTALFTHRIVNRVNAGRLPHGTALCAYAVLYGILRCALDPLRADGRPERFLGLSHQQGFALGLMLAGAVGWWLLLAKPMGGTPPLTSSTAHSVPSHNP